MDPGKSRNIHPLAWWLKRRLAVTAEHACDEIAVRAIGTPASYVEVLRDMAATVRRLGGRLRWQGVGMDGTSLLAHRIEHVLRGPRAHAVSRARKIATAACCGVAIVAVTACRLPNAERADDDTQRMAEWLIDRHSDTEVTVSQADRPFVEELLLRRRDGDPTGPWSARLGRFYAASMFGYWARLTEGGPLQEVTKFDPTSEFAAAAGETLAASTDPVMLTAAAQFLRHSPHYGDSYSERDVLAREHLERAVQLDPESVDARTELVSVVARARRTAEWRFRLEEPPVSQGEAVMRLPAAERFELLPQAAIGAYISARNAAASNNPNEDRYVRVKFENAKRFADDLLVLAAEFRTDPDVGTAVYKANMVLASLALRDGNTETAIEHLRRASMAPPSDELVYGHRIASWWVVDDLVQAGERDAVIAFLERMAETSIVDQSLLLESADLVRRGQPPTELMEGVHGAMP